jgi:hypothetical protein
MEILVRMLPLTSRNAWWLAGGCLLSLAACGELSGANWLGAATPEERRAAREKMKSSFNDLGVGPLPLVGPAEDGSADIRGENIYSYMKDFVDFSEQSRREGDLLWGRVAGMKAQHQTAEYIERKFHEFGLEKIHVDSFVRNPQWWPTKSRISVTLKESDGKSAEFVFPSAFPVYASPPVPSGALEAELVDVGLGRPVDLLGRDVRGKVAVIHSFPQLGIPPLRYTGYGVAPQLAKLGAVGVITVLDVPGNVQTFDAQGNAKSAPSFTLGDDDGNFLEDLIARAKPSDQLRVRMELRVEMKEGLTTQNVYGVVPGNTDEYIIVMAHQDGWFDAAVDNASGLATMLVLAQHYASQKNRHHNLLFVATAGHHLSGSSIGNQRSLGASSPGTRYLIDHYPDILKKTVLALNCEHTATRARQLGGQIPAAQADFDNPINTENARWFDVSNHSPLLLGFVREAINRYGLTVVRFTDPVPHGDSAELGEIVPTVSMLEAGLWYHSTGDRPEVIPSQGLERTARAFAYLLDKVDGASRDSVEQGRPPKGR